MFDELTQFAAQLGPEFANVNIVSTDDVPSVPSACLFGFAIKAGSSPFDDRQLVALNLDAIEDAAKPGRQAACVKSVLIHELGHCATIPPVEWADADREFIGDAMPQLRARLLMRDSKIPEPPIDSPESYHGAAFLRSMLHLYGRAIQLGADVPTDLYGSAGNGWLSPEADYMRTLQGEIIAMRGERFANILATPAPAAFDELWTADIDLYRANEQARIEYHRQRQERAK